MFASLLLLAPLALGATPARPAPVARPKLIVTLVIDQFRADYLMRFESRFLPAKDGGFRYLMEKGAYFRYAQYDILQSMTCPGHATVLTGSYPYNAGIPINDWYDGEDRVYCAEDKAFPTVGAETKAHIGTSPKNLLATTLGDELKNAGYPSRVVSVAIKDRAAIMMGGHRADLALWHDSGADRWVSSQFYLPDGKLPAWVEKLNAENEKAKGSPIQWKLTSAGTGFSVEDSSPRDHDGPHASSGIGKVFPHDAQAGSRSALTMPHGLELTEQAAERAIEAYDLGRGKSTDLLAISFSSHDYVGHMFGPNSREMEEMTVAEDRLIARLLGFIRKRVPAEQTLIVLTGDHGVEPVPEYAKAQRYDAGRIDEDTITVELEAKLTEKFGAPASGKWIPFAHDLNWFLNRKALAEKKLERRAVLDFARDFLAAKPGFFHVITANDVAQRRLPAGMHERQVLHTYFPGRSGDLVAIPRPYWVLAGDTTTHLTGFSFDRTVPLAIAGFGVKPGLYATDARVIDIAPTLAWLSGVIPPSLSEGRVLNEILQLTKP